MSSQWKVLAQLNPSATILTDFYIVPPGKMTVCSSLVVCNRSDVLTQFRISVAINGSTDDLEQYIAYDATIVAHDVVDFTIGMTLSEGDTVRVYAKDAHLSFNLFGEEIS